MAEPAAKSGRIFISYRREETEYAAGWLYDVLAERFGGNRLFKDVDSIDPGDDFAEVIAREVASCQLLLALIGDRWLTVVDEQGRRRLDDPADFVRLEIEAALQRGIRVVPMLVGRARMPRAAELPPSLAKLATRQAVVLPAERFRAEAGRLIAVIERNLRQATGERPAVPAPAVAGSTQAAQEARPGPPLVRGPTRPKRQSSGTTKVAGTRPGGPPATPNEVLANIAKGEAWPFQSMHALISGPAHTLLHPEPVMAMVFSPDGARLATAGADNKARVWDATDGTRLSVLASQGWLTAAGRLLQGHGMRAVAFSPDGGRLATASDDHTVQVWDLSSGHRLTRIRIEGGADSVTFSPDGRSVAVPKAARPGAQLFDASTGAAGLSFRFGSTQALTMRLAFSPAGDMLAALDRHGRVLACDATTRQRRYSTGPPAVGPFTPTLSSSWPGIAFSPDGRWLVAIGGTGLRVLDARTGEQQALLERPAVTTDAASAATATRPGATWNFAFGAGGAWLATAGSDGLRFWEPASGRQLANFQHLVYQSLAVSPAGRWLAAAGGAGRAVMLHHLAG
jgi:WD40 repeat protein